MVAVANDDDFPLPEVGAHYELTRGKGERVIVKVREVGPDNIVLTGEDGHTFQLEPWVFHWLKPVRAGTA